jgi:DNA-binding TFAR19-related protein (PDSD5 family)
MLEHLTTIEFEPDLLDAPAEGFVPLKKAEAPDLLDAQVQTADWLKELGATDEEEVLSAAQEHTAVQAFTALTTGAPDPKAAVANITVPAAVRKTVAMLTAYNWKFVEQAQEIRGKAVAQLLEEIEHPDARIRLKAIEILGKVTEIGLFTERVEIKKAEMPDDELDNRIREKLAQLQKTVDMEEAEREKRNADAVDIETKDADED